MFGKQGSVGVPIETIEVSAYTIPTDFPEADGTYAWDRTTLVLVEAGAGGRRSLGYSYADTATAHLVKESLADVVRGRDAMDVPGAWAAMVHAIRNLGRPGVCSMAISAVDSCLWDLKARLLDLPLVKLLGAARDAAPVYGSGGFTSYSLRQLEEQLGGWAAQGIPRVKMKIGTHPEDDLGRVRAAREAIGPDVELFVDANGAYSRKQALAQAEAFTALGVQWFEELVSSDDLAGLHLLRDRGPAGMDIAAGEYGNDLWYFRRMLEAEAVDVLQADATRCAGITGFLQVGALCQARSLQLSAHCAPSLHAHPCCALIPFRHLEYFHDHARIEHMVFDGALTPVDGALHPDLTRPGMGLEFKHADAEPYAVWHS
jgi:L-alanine-DL-glutamate epimerase-like enolase superfamily enzyme